jgi:hypothetical protein
MNLWSDKELGLNYTNTIHSRRLILILYCNGVTVMDMCQFKRNFNILFWKDLLQPPNHKSHNVA